MIPLETIYGRPTIASELTPCAWAAPARGGIHSLLSCLLALKDAAGRTFSVSAVRSFFKELDVRDRLLSRLGWVLLCAVPLFAAIALAVSGPVRAASPWIKPIKFSISFASYAWTLSLMIEFLQLPRGQGRLLRCATTASIAIEMLLLGWQAWRNTHAYAGQGLAQILMSQAITAMVLVNTAVMVWILVLCCRNRAETGFADVTFATAIRNGIVIFLMGNAVGGYMLARGSHLVGAPGDDRGLPFLNWSMTGGDLRIAHFIALHAIQIVPLFAYLLWEMAPRPALKARKLAVLAMSTLVFLAVLGTFIQAALGDPLIRAR